MTKTRLKKQFGLKIISADAEVIAVTLGAQAAESTLQSALAMGADRGIFIKTDDCPDSLVTAAALKAAIESDGKPGLIFTGKESIDSEGFQTMFRLAAGLNIPAASNVVSFTLEQDRTVVECELEGRCPGSYRNVAALRGGHRQES